MVTWSDIKRWDPAELETAYDAFEKSEVAVQSAGDSLWDAANSFGNAGVHAESARGNLGRRRAEADKLEALLSDLMSCTRVAATNVSNVKNGVLEAEGYADRERLTIDSNGSVSIRPEVKAEAEEDARERNKGAGARLGYWTYDMMPVWRRAVSAKAELERFIRELIDNAETTDSEYTGALNSIKHGEASDGSIAASSGSSTSNIDSQALLDLLNKEGSVSDVRAAWDALSPEQQQALIDNHHVEIGAMNGIPFEARVQANDKNIDREVSELNAEIEKLTKEIEDGKHNDKWFTFKDEEEKAKETLETLTKRRDYFETLRSGDGNGAVLFDPDNNRVIEMVGDPSGATKDVVTFVSGTNTTINSVGDYADLPDYLVREGNVNGNPTVAFNFYDGRFQGEDKWISWPWEDPKTSNDNPWHLRELGANLAEFQEAVAAEDFSRNAESHVIGHSAGHSVVTASEFASKTRDGVPDAHYDHVHSLSGSYAPYGWSQQGSTEYDHYAYEGEPIHFLDYQPVWATPQAHDAWENHIFDPTTAGDSDIHKPENEPNIWKTVTIGELKEEFGKETDILMDLHTRTAEGNDERNHPVLEALTAEIYRD